MPRAEVMRNLLAVGVIAIPLSIALAVAIGMPPIAGLYTAVFAGAVASATGAPGSTSRAPPPPSSPCSRTSSSPTVLRHCRRSG